MYLKRLQLTGFKTFADRTEILFSPGVTAIVGPNGSGKSNIADAVLWVLGEQKASAVRGVRSQDVIFNGSAKRKQTGLAEVSLTVDNSDGTLPLAFNEVTVTRRALRSGDSDYFINKTPCRLKDIYELFLDTGVGREAYALVNQSEIDAVLTAAPESRRGLFEEAAGIKKYRVKKRDAIRKLEATELNLSRITDIIAEISSRLAPLHLQAETAKRYLQLKEQLNRVEEDYLVSELRSANDQLVAARSARKSDELLTKDLTDRLAEAEAHAGQLASEAKIAEQTLDEMRKEHDQIRSTNDRLHNDRRLSLERLQALSAQEELHKKELSELLPRLELAQSRLTELEAEAALTGEQAGDRHKVQSDSEDQLRRLNDKIGKAQTETERRRKEAEAAARRRASEEGEMARAEARLSEAKANAALLEQDRSGLQAEIDRCTAALEAAKGVLAVAETGLKNAEREGADARDRRLQQAEALAALRREYETVRGDGLSISVRLKSLQDLENAQEGYFAGVKSVLSGSQAGRLPGQYTVVADAFDAPEHLVVALETAFGSSLQDIITDTEEAAKAAIEYLKRGSYGRATFLPLPRMKGSRLDHRGGSLGRGVLGSAIDLISFDPAFRPALEALVGRVYICETLDDALRLSNSVSGWSRIVTTAGEVVVPSGAITGGSQNRRGSSLLERKAEITRLEHSLEAQRREEERTAAAVSSALGALKDAEQKAESFGDRTSDARLALSSAKQQLDRSSRDLTQATDRAAAQDRRAATALEGVRYAEDRLKVCANILRQLTSEVVESDGETAQTELKEMLAERDILNAKITQERINRAALSEKSSGLVRALRIASSELEQLIQQRDRRTRLIEQVAADHTVLSRHVAETAGQIEQSDRALRQAHEQLTAQAAVRQAAAQQAAESTSVIRELNTQRAELLSGTRKYELTETKCEMAISQIAARLLEEYSVTAESALSRSESPSVPADGPREVARLRRELKGLGDVNVGAVDEFDRLSERFAHVTAQKNDAEDAKARIYSAIREIDESTRDVFMKTFHEVQSAFQIIFDRLFSGGTAQLKLTNAEDLLETGIDILVQLPGKKQQNLQLLSGGERALTAVALLFSFLKVRPAPFCLLDEVDAPLDGANIERFADLLREFGQSTQFLVITHNPATMESAQVWYGVTMQEPGISRILSLQVPQPLQAA